MIIRLASLNEIRDLGIPYYELETDDVRFLREHFVYRNRDEVFFSNIFGRDTKDTLVAEQNGKVIGFAHVMILEQKADGYPVRQEQTGLREERNPARKRGPDGFRSSLISAG